MKKVYKTVDDSREFYEEMEAAFEQLKERQNQEVEAFRDDWRQRQFQIDDRQLKCQCCGR